MRGDGGRACGTGPCARRHSANVYFAGCPREAPAPIFGFDLVT
jgi:hypothetical protein